MKTEYEIAEDFFNRGDYMDAFSVFKRITESTLSSNDDKADAFNMMGVIVLIDTRVENSDESGLEYFAKSLEYNHKNVGALLNVIEGFGLSVNNHRNITLFDRAIKILENINYNYSETEKIMIGQKIKLKETILKESQ